MRDPKAPIVTNEPLIAEKQRRTPKGLVDLQAIDERAAAATPLERWRSGVLWHDGAYPTGPYTRNEAQATAGSRFIQHAREDVPVLVSLVQRLQRDMQGSIEYGIDAVTRTTQAKYDALLSTLREHGAHTAECLATAARTQRSFCIAECADRWRPLIAPELVTKRDERSAQLGKVLLFTHGEHAGKHATLDRVEATHGVMKSSFVATLKLFGGDLTTLPFNLVPSYLTHEDGTAISRSFSFDLDEDVSPG